MLVFQTPEQLLLENVSTHLIPHKTFSGNRPSLSLLLPSLNAYNIGQLLAIYEHRIAVEGFIWGINSFDQWGVELGGIWYPLQQHCSAKSVKLDHNPFSTLIVAKK